MLNDGDRLWCSNSTTHNRHRGSSHVRVAVLLAGANRFVCLPVPKDYSGAKLEGGQGYFCVLPELNKAATFPGAIHSGSPDLHVQ